MSEQYLGKSALAKVLGVTTRHSFVAGPWGQIDEAVDRGEDHGEIAVGGKKVLWMKRSGHPAISEVGAFRALFDARPTADENFLNRSDLAAELNVYVTHKVIVSAWHKMSEQIAAGSDQGTFQVGEREVQWRSFYSARNIKFPFVARSSIDAFRAALDKIPQKASDDQVSFSRLAGLVGIAQNHPMLAEFIDEISADIGQGAKSGSIKVGGELVPWTMLLSKWGGSSRWGGATPHVPASAASLFERELSRRVTHGPMRIVAGLRYDDLTESIDEATGHDLEFEVENEIEVGLIARRDGRERPLTVFAVPTANDNLLFEVLGGRHLITADRRVLQRASGDGRAGWVKSAFLSVDPAFEFPKKAARTPISMKP